MPFYVLCFVESPQISYMSELANLKKLSILSFKCIFKHSYNV